MDLVQLCNRFQTELDAVKYFEAKRWRGGIRCPYCNSMKHGVRNVDYRFHCKNCNKSYSVTTKTWLHNTRIPLRTWMMAIVLVTNAKKGLSALQLQRDLHVNYRTAWRITMKLRQKMMRDNKPIQLSNVVEMDETYVGGAPRTWKHPDLLDYTKKQYDTQLEDLKRRGIEVKSPDAYKKKYATDVKRGRGTNKTAVVGIVERDGRVIAEVMKTLTYDNLEALVRRNVKDVDETVVITDKFKGYNKFNEVFNHIVVDHSKMYAYKGIHTSTIESFWAIIKRGIMGQYHHVSLKYLPEYIMEFVYKYNNRRNVQGTMFNEITRRAVETQH